jgi:hypothetical protein
MALKYKENTTANYYVYMLESGNDANDGLTPATAIKTCERAVAILEDVVTTKRRYVVSDRRKIYNESITTTRTAGKPITWEFLNRCVIDGSGTLAVTFRMDNELFINCVITGYDTNGVYFFQYNGDAIRVSLRRCQIISNYNNGIFMHTSLQNNHYLAVYLDNCVVSDTVRMMAISGEISRTCFINRSVLINTHVGTTAISYLLNSIVDNITLGSTIANFRIVNCDIISTINNQNDTYYKGIGQNLNGISADPLFNDSANNVYTVTSASPCLYAGTNNQHIGLGEAYYLNATTLLTDAVASSNVELSGGKLIRTDVDLDGYVETKVFHNGTNRIISTIDLAATLGYLNENVIQSVQLDSADASNPYPAFLTFKLKVGETESACNASDWITLPFNQQPLIDEAGIGNGSEDIDATDVWSSIKINYFKLYIYIANP